MTKRLVSAHASPAMSFVQRQTWLSSGWGGGMRASPSLSHSPIKYMPHTCLPSAVLEIAWTYSCAPPVSSNNLCMLGVEKEIARQKGK